MNNCLITQLRTSVNDDTLEYLGSIVIGKKYYTLTKDNAYSLITPIDGYTLTAQIITGGFLDNNLALITDKEKLLNGDSIYIASNSKVKIYQKYYIKQISSSFSIINLNHLYNLPNLEVIYTDNSNFYGTIDMLKHNTNISVIYFANTSYTLSGNIESLSELLKLEQIVLHKSNCTGDITKAFGKCTKLNTLDIADTDCYGSLNEFVNTQIQYGRTTGTIAINYPTVISKIKQDNIPLSQHPSVIQLSSSFAYITWTEDGTITWHTYE